MRVIVIGVKRHHGRIGGRIQRKTKKNDKVGIK